MPPRSRNPYAVVAPGQEEVSEDLLKQRVLNRCRELDLFVMHPKKVKVTKRGRSYWLTAYEGTGNGFPDLTIVGHREIKRELKVGDNTLSPDQKEWMARLRFAGSDFSVWTDQHWDTGLIEAELCKLAGGIRYGYERDGFTPSREFGPDLVVSSGLAARAARGEVR
jgi:hypothetical protein